MIADRVPFSRYSERVSPSPIRTLAPVPDPNDAIPFGPGEPDASLFPVSDFRDALVALLDDPKASKTALQYSDSAGNLALRGHICRRMAKHGVALSTDNILITSGAQQGIHLTTAAFVDPGDSVLVQSPTYPGALQVFQACGAVVESLDGEGAAAGSKLIYTMSTFQNPTGGSLSLRQKRDLLATARKQGSVLIEDDPYEALRYDGEPSPPMLALDAEDASVEAATTLYLGSFSKLIAPGLRLGWVAGPKEIIAKLTLMKQCEDLQAGSLVQAALVGVLDKGYDEQERRLRQAYCERRDCMLEALTREFGNRGEWTVPQGGFFIWVTLPERADARELQRQAARLGVTFVPGGAFSHDGRHANSLRLSFSSAPPQRIAEGVRRLARAYDLVAP